MNEQNLIQNSERTPSELREIARKGGKASGISRGFRSAVKKRFKEHPELIDELITELLAMAQEEHNIKAFNLLVELSGESANQQLLKLKKEELKLKKQMLQSGADGEQELPALYKALEESDE